MTQPRFAAFDIRECTHTEDRRERTSHEELLYTIRLFAKRAEIEHDGIAFTLPR